MALIKCPECGKDISDTVNTCIHCGFPIKEYIVQKRVIHCPECKNVITDNSKVCSQCGYSLNKKIENKKLNNNIINVFSKVLIVLMAVVFGMVLFIIGGLFAKKTIEKSNQKALLRQYQNTIKVNDTYAVVVNSNGKISLDGYGSNGFVPDTSGWGTITHVFPIGNGLIAKDDKGYIHMACFPDQDIRIDIKSDIIGVADVVGIILGLTSDGEVELLYDEFNMSNDIISQIPREKFKAIGGGGALNTPFLYTSQRTDTWEWCINLAMIIQLTGMRR